uniref:CSON001217 protein n=1 Tax=Culicoides sonorensis TaxID=179676 RepID=A0A336LTU6_CULSO
MSYTQTNFRLTIFTCNSRIIRLRLLPCRTPCACDTSSSGTKVGTDTSDLPDEALPIITPVLREPEACVLLPRNEELARMIRARVRANCRDAGEFLLLLLLEVPFVFVVFSGFDKSNRSGITEYATLTVSTSKNVLIMYPINSVHINMHKHVRMQSSLLEEEEESNENMAAFKYEYYYIKSQAEMLSFYITLTVKRIRKMYRQLEKGHKFQYMCLDDIMMID